MKKGRTLCSILLCAVLGLSVLGLGAGMLNSASLQGVSGGSNAVNFSDSTGGGYFF